MEKNISSSTNTIVIIIAAISLISLAFSIISYFNQPKMAYIDSSILLQKYQGAVQASETLTQETEEWSGNIKTLEDELTTLNTEFVEKGASWNKSKVIEKQKRLETKQQEYYKYRRAIEEKAAKREQELMQPVFDQLNADIADYAKKKGYNLILGTVTGGNILYGADVLDITEEFLEYANNLVDE
jgi:outer membrane protein